MSTGHRESFDRLQGVTVLATVRRGFTLIELLIVILVIGILTSLLILGINHVLRSSKEQATKLLLGNLQGMLAELDAKTRLANSPPMWRWADDTGMSETEPQLDGESFWKLPFHTGTVAYRNVNTVTPPAFDTLDAPGDVRVGSGDMARSVSRQILYTQQAMTMMLALPANRAALEKIATDKLFTPTYMTGNVATPGKDGVLGSNTDGTDSTEPVFYPIGARVVYLGNRYRCADVGGYAASGSTPTAPDFIADSSPSVPLLLDAWGNPILFVPATGLRTRLLNDKSTYDPTDINQNTIILSPEGQQLPRSNNVQPQVTKAGRPFFASAGPDGDFSKGDDNVYSFEP